jgi:hypothetical protein
MEKHSSSKAGRAKSILESLHQVIWAAIRRNERDRLASEAREKIFQLFPGIQESELEGKWKEIEQTAQLFREAFYSGEDGYRNKRIIDLVWQGVENNKVNVERDREDNEGYTGAHLRFLQKMGIPPEQYESKGLELKAYLQTAPEEDWKFDQAIHDEDVKKY